MSECVCACGLRMEENCDCYGHGKPERADEAAAEITRLRADLTAAQEREQRMREALARVAALRHDHDFSEASAMAADEIARDALGEPQ